MTATKLSIVVSNRNHKDVSLPLKIGVNLLGSRSTSDFHNIVLDDDEIAPEQALILVSTKSEAVTLVPLEVDDSTYSRISLSSQHGDHSLLPHKSYTLDIGSRFYIGELTCSVEKENNKRDIGAATLAFNTAATIPVTEVQNDEDEEDDEIEDHQPGAYSRLSSHTNNNNNQNSTTIPLDSSHGIQTQYECTNSTLALPGISSAAMTTQTVPFGTGRPTRDHDLDEPSTIGLTTIPLPTQHAAGMKEEDDGGKENAEEDGPAATMAIDEDAEASRMEEDAKQLDITQANTMNEAIEDDEEMIVTQPLGEEEVHPSEAKTTQSDGGAEQNDVDSEGEDDRESVRSDDLLTSTHPPLNVVTPPDSVRRTGPRSTKVAKVPEALTAQPGPANATTEEVKSTKTPTDAESSNLSEEEMRKELKDLGLSTVGGRTQLLERLAAHHSLMKDDEEERASMAKRKEPKTPSKQSLVKDEKTIPDTVATTKLGDISTVETPAPVHHEPPSMKGQTPDREVVPLHTPLTNKDEEKGEERYSAVTTAGKTETDSARVKGSPMSLDTRQQIPMNILTSTSSAVAPSDMTLPQLRDELSALGLDTKGKKKDLVDRLTEHLQALPTSQTTFEAASLLDKLKRESPSKQISDAGGAVPQIPGASDNVPAKVASENTADGATSSKKRVIHWRKEDDDEFAEAMGEVTEHKQDDAKLPDRSSSPKLEEKASGRRGAKRKGTDDQPQVTSKKTTMEDDGVSQSRTSKKPKPMNEETSDKDSTTSGKKKAKAAVTSEEVNKDESLSGTVAPGKKAAKSGSGSASASSSGTKKKSSPSNVAKQPSMRVMFTNIEPTDHHIECVKQLGGEIASGTDYHDVTHLVCLKGSMKRTLKLLHVMAIPGPSSPRVVHVDWLVNSAKEGHVLDSNDYYPFEGDQSMKDALRLRDRDNTEGLLYGITVLVAEKGIQPSFQELAPIVKEAGGIVKIVNAKSLNECFPKASVVLGTDESFTKSLRQIVEKRKISWCRPSWIFQSLASYSLKTGDDHIINRGSFFI